MRHSSLRSEHEKFFQNKIGIVWLMSIIDELWNFVLLTEAKRY